MTIADGGAPLVRDLWSGKRTAATAVAAALTAPLSVLFWWAVRLRDIGYRTGLLTTQRAPIPVVSVGNLAVGGTGKTPVSRWLVEALSAKGWHPALVVRGYGEDEVRLHRRWNPDVPVVVSPRRAEGVREAAERGCDVAVLDDGFQHRGVGRDLDVVLLSAAHAPPFRVLPRGPFREPPGALRRADHVLVTAKGAGERPAARQLVVHAKRIVGQTPVDLFPLLPATWQSFDGKAAEPLPGPPLVVCSVAEPRGFVALVGERLGPGSSDLEVAAFADHHDYTPDDCESLRARANGRWIATTEKDAVKLAECVEHLPEVRVLPLEPRPEPGLADALLAPLGDPPGRSS